MRAAPGRCSSPASSTGPSRVRAPPSQACQPAPCTAASTDELHACARRELICCLPATGIVKTKLSDTLSRTLRSGALLAGHRPTCFRKQEATFPLGNAHPSVLRRRCPVTPTLPPAPATGHGWLLAIPIDTFHPPQRCQCNMRRHFLGLPGGQVSSVFCESCLGKCSFPWGSMIGGPELLQPFC